MIRRSLVLAALAVFAGCITAEDSFRDKALDRAAFEMSCPKEQVRYSVLHRNDGMGCAGSQMAVIGCGKKAVYVCTRTQDWINNTGVADAK
jgi:hypothetical protein